jgi:hypothetical protein
MIIDDLDVEGIAVGEPEAYSPLIVDADAPLSGTVASQGFQAIGRRQAEVLDPRCGLQLNESHGRTLQDLRWQPA